MRCLLLSLAVVGNLATCGVQTGLAQQQSRRSVTYTFQQSSVSKAQWSPDSVTANPPASNGPAAINAGTTPGLLPAQTQGANNNQIDAATNQIANSPSNNSGPRPTAQQLQNPSGAYNFSHSGMSSSQYISPNNYLGSQFNNWNNIRLQPNTLDQFQSFNRTQPPATSGYFSPNTYFGPGFSQWNNMSSGSPTPNYLGGYIYQP